MRIIGLIGMPGSGKSVASEVARGMGLEVIVMGDVIRKEAASLDLEPTDENLGMVGNMLRSTDGPAAIAKRTIDLARRSKRDLVIIDGLRSAEEADFFERNSEDFMLVEIFASSKARVRRIASRGRSDDASLDVAALALERRESREMSWGMLKAIRAADLRIRNDGDLDDFRTKVELLFRDIESKCI